MRRRDDKNKNESESENKNSTSDKKPRNDWHSGFAGGLGLGFRKYRADLIIEREIPLTKEPLLIDFLVIKKRPDTVVDNVIGRTFRMYNIIEYKNPDDALDVDTIWKGIGYAGIYKGLSEKTNGIPADELTLSIFRTRMPRKLFSEYKKQGKQIENPYPGVYMINGVIDMPLQIVVTRELRDKDFAALRIMTHGADEHEVREFLKKTTTYREKGDRIDANAVLFVSAAVNRGLFERLRKEKAMSNIWSEIMSEEYEKGIEKGIEKGMEKGRTEGVLETLFSLVGDGILSIKDAAVRAGLTERQFKSRMQKAT